MLYLYDTFYGIPVFSSVFQRCRGWMVAFLLAGTMLVSSGPALAQITLPVLGTENPISGEVTDELSQVPGVDFINDLRSDASNATWQDVVQLLFLRIVQFVLIALQIAAVIYIVSVGIGMVGNMENADQLQKHTLHLVNAVIGFVVMSMGAQAVNIFNPALQDNSDTNVAFFNLDSWQGFVALLIDLLRYSVWVVAVVLIIIIGVKMVTSQEKDTKKERQQLTYVGIGLFLIQIADLVVKPFLVLNQGGIQADDLQGVERVAAGNELILNVGSVIMTFFAPLALFGLIMGAFYMVTAHGNEEMVSRGKKILTGTIIAIIVAYSSYTIVAEVLTYFIV